MAKKYQWHKIAETEAELRLSSNHTTTIEAGGKKMCVAKHDHQLYACTHKCPHAGGQLDEGWIDAAGNMVCPLHRYKFSLQNGRNVSGEGYFLKTYPIEIRSDGIYVGIETGGFFNW